MLGLELSVPDCWGQTLRSLCGAPGAAQCPVWVGARGHRCGQAPWGRAPCVLQPPPPLAVPAPRLARWVAAAPGTAVLRLALRPADSGGLRLPALPAPSPPRREPPRRPPAPQLRLPRRAALWGAPARSSEDRRLPRPAVWRLSHAYTVFFHFLVSSAGFFQARGERGNPFLVPSLPEAAPPRLCLRFSSPAALWICCLWERFLTVIFI